MFHFFTWEMLVWRTGLVGNDGKTPLQNGSSKEISIGRCISMGSGLQYSNFPRHGFFYLNKTHGSCLFPAPKFYKTSNRVKQEGVQ